MLVWVHPRFTNVEAEARQTASWAWLGPQGALFSSPSCSFCDSFYSRDFVQEQKPHTE